MKKSPNTSTSKQHAAGGNQLTTSEHIPPIIFESGSVILKTVDKVPNADPNGHSLRKKKHTLLVGKDIRWVRVLLSNGDIVFNAYHNDMAKGGKIKIWVSGDLKDDDKHPIEIKKGGGNLELATDKEFVEESSVAPYKRKYSGNDIMHVQIRDKNDRTVFEYRKPSLNDDAVVCWILVWVE